MILHERKYMEHLDNFSMQMPQNDEDYLFCFYLLSNQAIGLFLRLP